MNRSRALVRVLALIGAALAALLIVAVGFWATWQQASALAYRHSFDKLDSPWLWFLRFVCTPFLTAGFKLGLKSAIAFSVEAVMDLVFWTVLSFAFVQRVGRRRPA